MPFDQMLANATVNLGPWWPAVKAILALCGLCLFLKGLHGLAAGRGGRGGLSRQLWYLLPAALLVNNGALLDALSHSLLGAPSVAGLSFQAPGHPARNLIQFAVHLVALIGLIGIGRGIMLLRMVGERPGAMAPALTHVIGGILCVNLVPTLKLVAGTLGQDALDLLTAITG
jgi:hypothetical protein